MVCNQSFGFFLMSAFRRRLDSVQRIGFIAYPDFQVLSLCTVSAFECANILSAKLLYELHMLSETGGPIRTSSGLILETTKFNDDQFDACR
jgi:transcriptional regulator GlxA family with amidase domain